MVYFLIICSKQFLEMKYNSPRKKKETAVAYFTNRLAENSFYGLPKRHFLPLLLLSFRKVHYFKCKLYQPLSRCRQIQCFFLNCGHFHEVAISNQIQTFWRWINILCSCSSSLMLGRMQLPVLRGGNVQNI